MNVFLWIVQAVLAAMFAMAGVMKATQPKDKLVGRLPWTADFSQAPSASSASWSWPQPSG
ncbi:hypothetical protein [Streptomyces sp. NBC_00280]|uniref:hypothetical protein n=1 Tax=Streptomyces sp. NBC_00280 TaxID=2975699 RepID=UPI00352F91F8